MWSCRHSEKEGGKKSNSRTIKCLVTPASCSPGGRRGTEVRDAGIRLVHKLSLQIMCSSAHPRYARFCCGSTHTNTLAQTCSYTHTCFPRIIPTAFWDDENESYPSGGLELNMARNAWDSAEPPTGPWQGRSLAGFSSYKAYRGPGLEGGLVKCDRWLGLRAGMLSHPPGLRTLVIQTQTLLLPWVFKVTDTRLKSEWKRYVGISPMRW